MTTENLETPEVFADRDDVWGLLYPALTGSVARDVAAKVARARDAQIAAKARELADVADREGAASALRALAAMLEGGT